MDFLDFLLQQQQCVQCGSSNLKQASRMVQLYTVKYHFECWCKEKTVASLKNLRAEDATRNLLFF